MCRLEVMVVHLGVVLGNPRVVDGDVEDHPLRRGRYHSDLGKLEAYSEILEAYPRLKEA
jgi:hypothetical protein